MFNIFANFSLIFIAIALLGFLLSEAFNWGKTPKIIGVYNSSIEIVFHFLGISILVITTSIIFLTLIIASPNPENQMTQSYFFLENIVIHLETNGAIPLGTINTFYQLLAPAFIISLFYFALYSIVINLGVIFREFSNIWVIIEFNDEVKAFPRILHKDADYVYVEENDKSVIWRAIRKTDIISMNTVFHRSKYSLFFEKFSKTWKQNKKDAILNFISYHSILLMTLFLVGLMFLV